VAASHGEEVLEAAEALLVPRLPRLVAPLPGDDAEHEAPVEPGEVGLPEGGGAGPEPGGEGARGDGRLAAEGEADPGLGGGSVDSVALTSSSFISGAIRAPCHSPSGPGSRSTTSSSSGGFGGSSPAFALEAGAGPGGVAAVGGPPQNAVTRIAAKATTAAIP